MSFSRHKITLVGFLLIALFLCERGETLAEQLLLVLQLAALSHKIRQLTLQLLNFIFEQH